jgi:hypothetical protein
MSGFFHKMRQSFSQNSVGDFLKDLSNMGVKDKHSLIKNSYSIGYNEDAIISQFGDNLDEYEYLSLLNNISNKYLPFFDRQYTERRPYLRAIAKEVEVENVLTILCDECIVYDDSNYFCKVEDILLELKNKDAFQKSLENNFKSVYSALGFNDPTTAWWLFFKFLVDGFLAFEIIYNDDENKIIGFKEIDPITLQMGIDTTGQQIWIQYKDDAMKQRILYESQIVYISYASSLIDSRTSYVERLIKPYNLLQTMEQTRLTWSVVNASYRLKFIIPIGGKSKTQAKQSMRKLMSRYNEEISFDNESGTFSVSGKPYVPGVRQWWFPSKNGEQPEAETIGGDGPDLNDTDQLMYFRRKFIKSSKIPMSRFEDEGGGMTIDNGSNQITQEEARFNRFVIRLRSLFKELITKPLYLQMMCDYPDLKDDLNVKHVINVKFLQYNLFEELKEMEIQSKKIDHITRLMEMVDADQTPYFDIEYLVKRFGLISEEDIRKNKEMRDKRRKTMPVVPALGNDPLIKMDDPSFDDPDADEYEIS